MFPIIALALASAIQPFKCRADHVSVKCPYRKGISPHIKILESTEPDDLCFARLHLKTEAAETFRKNTVESIRVIPILKGAYPVIRISAHYGTACQLRFDHVLEPFIQHLMQINI